MFNLSTEITPLPFADNQETFKFRNVYSPSANGSICNL